MKTVDAESQHVPQETDRVPEEVSALADLLESTRIEVHGPVVQVAASTWIIYGAAAYDGETIVGEYSDAGSLWRCGARRCLANTTPRRDPSGDDEPVQLRRPPDWPRARRVSRHPRPNGIHGSWRRSVIGVELRRLRRPGHR